LNAFSQFLGRNGPGPELPFPSAKEASAPFAALRLKADKSWKHPPSEERHPSTTRPDKKAFGFHREGSLILQPGGQGTYLFIQHLGRPVEDQNIVHVPQVSADSKRFQGMVIAGIEVGVGGTSQKRGARAPLRLAK